MKAVLKKLFSSKKFVSSLIGMILSAAGVFVSDGTIQTICTYGVIVIPIAYGLIEGTLDLTDIIATAKTALSNIDTDITEDETADKIAEVVTGDTTQTDTDTESEN